MNSIYKKLLKNKIEQFVADFKSSRDVFENIDRKNKLIHPGEFGMFRENICDELIKFSIPGKFKTATGFLINSFDEVSSQCDLVIFDFNNTPLIQDNSSARFFPVESTIAIGEIKSKLTNKQLMEALLALAKNKMIKKIDVKRVSNVIEGKENKFNPEINCYDTMFSFIICEQIKNFNFKKLDLQINSLYEKNNIPYEYRHNMVLSLENGIIAYKAQSDFLNIKASQLLYFPKALDNRFINYHINSDVIENITNFLTSLSNFLMVTNVYYPEPNVYNN